jgi:hypothetical protein
MESGTMPVSPSSPNGEKRRIDVFAREPHRFSRLTIDLFSSSHTGVGGRQLSGDCRPLDPMWIHDALAFKRHYPLPCITMDDDTTPATKADIHGLKADVRRLDADIRGLEGSMQSLGRSIRSGTDQVLEMLSNMDRRTMQIVTRHEERIAKLEEHAGIAA